MLTSLQARLAPLWPGFKAVWQRDRDPFLNELRWRLHLRLLLINAVLTSALLLRSLLNHGSWDLGLGLMVILLAWVLLRRFPAYNRWVVRGVLAFFACLALIGLRQRPDDHYPSELLALMVMPVFATLLDGIATGALVLGLALSGSWLWLALHPQATPSIRLAVFFTFLSSASLYFCCMAHTWIFTSLVEQRRRSTLAVAATRKAIEGMAATLSDQVFSLTKRLQSDLHRDGLAGVEAADILSQLLKRARTDRPAEIPHNSLVPADLLQHLRRSALIVFLGIAFALSAVSWIVMLIIHPPQWQLAAAMTLASGILCWTQSRDQAWHGRLRVFIVLAMLTFLADAFLSATTPPASSFVFLPVVIFFAAMLDDLLPALFTCAAALAIMALNYNITVPMDASYAALLSTLAILLPCLVAISAATLPMYRVLLEHLSAEESQLAVSLGAYRRLMSTFFHDLANPLAVLRALASLPVALQTSEDVLRAQRMALRMDAVAQAARQALLGADIAQTQTTLGQLGDELYDLFKERLREKGLQWKLSSGSELSVAQSGPLLRDSVLGNLLSNAVKFSPPGASLELRAWRDNSHMHVQLSDTGRGIPAQVLADLAQGRTPASQLGTEGETGSGFGLLLAKTYMAELGGRLELRPRLSGGTEAELILPLA